METDLESSDAVTSEAMSGVYSVVIVGGGTAGWLTAAIIAAKHRHASNDQLQILLIESADVPTIGVGEGTWPTMKNTLQQIGVGEKELFKHCHAAFKQGGKFVNWVHGNGDFYYHPFTVPLGYGRIDLAPYIDHIEGFAERANYQHSICEAGLAPRSLSDGEFKGQCNYAYHLDATALGDLLRDHCTQKLGVRHQVATVNSVQVNDNGEITSLGLESVDSLDNNVVEADLFVDCTGFKSLILGEALKVPFRSVDDVLFNDSALAIQVPYEEENNPLACHTIATAQNAGWIWDIGLTHRRGVGHVYSSRYISDDDAESNLRHYLGRADEDSFDARVIRFNSGYRKKFWHKNCVAVGLSAGFVEPLEATAIMLVEIAARFIAENLHPQNELMPITARRFNQQMDYRWSRIIDFLKLHYLLNQRKEAYWQDHKKHETIPDSLKEDLTVWSTRGPANSDFEGPIELFPAASYQYVLYGMEFSPNFRLQSYLYQKQSQAERIMQQNKQISEQLLCSLPPHRDMIRAWLAAR